MVTSSVDAARPTTDEALAHYRAGENALVCREAVKRYRAHRAILDGLGYCECEHASHADSAHEHHRPAATHTHQTDFGVFRVCAECHAAGHMPADLPGAESGRRTPTPAEMDAILRRYPTGERAVGIRRAVERHGAHIALLRAQATRARTANGVAEAAAWLVEQQPHLSLLEAFRLVVGIVTRYRKNESERTGC